MSSRDSPGIGLESVSKLILNLSSHQTQHNADLTAFHYCRFKREIYDELRMNSKRLSDFHVKSHVAPSLVCNSKLQNNTTLEQTVKSSLTLSGKSLLCFLQKKKKLTCEDDVHYIVKQVS